MGHVRCVAQVEDAMKSLKDDPELKPMLEELETKGGWVGGRASCDCKVMRHACMCHAPHR